MAVDDETIDDDVSRVLANIRAEMGRNRFDAEQLAQRVEGMSPHVLRHRLRGDSDLRLRELFRIAHALDVPAPRLLDDHYP